MGQSRIQENCPASHINLVRDAVSPALGTAGHSYKLLSRKNYRNGHLKKNKLELGDKLHPLRTEALDFQMANVPISFNGIDVDEFWASIHKIRNVDNNQPVYSTLLVPIRALLSLPVSNADSQRCFSMV